MPKGENKHWKESLTGTFGMIFSWCTELFHPFQLEAFTFANFSDDITKEQVRVTYLLLPRVFGIKS